MRLGPFALEQTVGRGAMGVVWRAGGPERLVAAIKLCDPERGDPAAIARWFALEVATAARLVHPHIALVYDHGTVDDAQARALQVVPGTRWMAMEFASHGSLRTMRGRATWAQVRTWLVEVLDALALAHAHGLVHRDIKPANVLLCSDADPRPGLKLADFGAVWAGRSASDRAVGTRGYMAPEQLRTEDWRQLGPATDVFAVGRMAVALLGGSPAKHDRAVARAPAGFGGWVARCVASDPRDRFLCAADAASALQELAETAAPTRAATAPRTEASTTFDLLEDRDDAADPDAEERPAPRHPARLPACWWDEDPAAVVPPGVGIGLFGLREPPFVGRAAVRALLASELDAVRAEAQPRLIVLQGPEGTGTSRAAQWFRIAAARAGAAWTASGSCSPEGGPEDGVLGMLERALHTAGLDRAQTRAHLEGLGCDGSVANALSAALRPGSTDPPMGALAPASMQALRAIGPDRPWVVVVDEPGRHGPTLRWLAEVLALDEAPVLLVAAAATEAGRDEAVEGDPAAGLVAHPRARIVELGPLDATAMWKMLDALLELSAEARLRLVSVSGGQPGRMLTLLRNAAVSRRLASTPLGFSADPWDVRSESDGWADRLDRLLDATDRRVAALGALVGSRVALEDLRAAGGRVDLPVDRAVDRLCRVRLATIETDGVTLRFQHPTLVEHLRAEADARGDWALHRAWGVVLAGRTRPVERVLRGRLLFAAGDVSGLDAHFTALMALESQTDLAFVVRELRALDRLATRIPPDLRERFDARRWVVEATAVGSLGRPDEGTTLAQRAREAAARTADRELQALAAAVHGKLTQLFYGPREALPILDEAVALARGTDPALLAGTLQARAHVLMALGSLDQAEDQLREALDAFPPDDGSPGLCRAWMTLSIVLQTQGRAEEAHTALRRAEAALPPDSPHLKTRLALYNHLGVNRHLAGDLDGADAWYRRAADGYRAMGSRMNHAVINRLVVQLDRGEGREVQRGLVPMAQFARRSERPELLRIVVILGLAAAAHVGHRKELAGALTEAESVLDPPPPTEAGIRRLLASAGADALAHGHAALAQRCWQLARAVAAASKAPPEEIAAIGHDSASPGGNLGGQES